MKKLIFFILISLYISSLACALPTQHKTFLSFIGVDAAEGYRIYYDIKSIVGRETDDTLKFVDVGNVTMINISEVIGILDGHYYFVVTAYTTRSESGFSNEASGFFTNVLETPIALKIE